MIGACPDCGSQTQAIRLPTIREHVPCRSAWHRRREPASPSGRVAVPGNYHGGRGHGPKRDAS